MKQTHRFPIAIISTLALTVGAPIAASELPFADDDERAEEATQLEIAVGKRDDWILNLPPRDTLRRPAGGHLRFKNSARPTSALRATAAAPAQAQAATMAKQSLGFAVGGAGDINNFRKNIQNGFLPLPTDITTEGLYYDYFFDTGKPANECRQLFCPSYSLATTADPISGKPEYYMAVGLQSNLKVETFERKKLNLVVVLDISGSMKSPFNRYHYDRKRGAKPNESDARKKIAVARKAVQNLTQHLRGDDRFGMVVFNNGAHLAKPLNRVDEIDMDKIRTHIGKLPARGGTNFSAGYKKGAELLAKYRSDSAGEYENRIIYLTDAMPNKGQLSEDGLFGMTEKNARQGIHSTFVGIGVDFNSELIEAITKVRGANYFSAHSGESFNDLLDKDFDYIVTPMVFDLSLRLVAQGVTIDRVYGSPQADLSTGQVMRVNTLFPSRTSEQAVKGGLVLLKLSGKPAAGEMSLTASYEKRDGSRERDQQTVNWPAAASKNAPESSWFASSGVRKGVLLARYGNLLTNWILEERAGFAGTSKNNDTSRASDETTNEAKRLVMRPCSLSIMPRRGICLPPPKLGRYERRSRKLRVNPGSAQTLEAFLTHLRAQTQTLNDKTLTQEAALIEKLLALANGQKGVPGKRDDWKLR